ncbi:50S ribosomal protein L4 [Actinospongicola halichondriae]|uniref:50S ribosomal protein L4 n=1 Tax=Actinospongicola halichondriae TaxID=3236844 RepID=UPI003D3D3477
MTSVDVKNTAGDKVGSVELDDELFGIEPNLSVLHQVVTAQLAAKRAGTQSTKTRAEVRGGGAKPWKQKGTGRARQGSIRAPQWRGGGIALGPKPRKYDQRTPKKMVRLALRSALSDRAQSERIIVLDSWALDAPSTKSARVALETLGTEGRILAIVSRDDVNTTKSLANLANVHVCQPGELNAHDIIVSDWMVFTTDTLPRSSANEPAAKESA